jgi:xanthine dehydrogenase accessory factor
MNNPACVWICIERVEGSSPREVGAWMRVTQADVEGTVGGGHLEFDAIAKARQMLQTSPFSEHVHIHRYALGPSLGQCCGGVVWLRMACIAAHNASELTALRENCMRVNESKSLKIALFGGGHVGKAIVRALENLPCQVHWIDSRDEIFPPKIPANTRTEHSLPVQAAAADLAPQSHVLIMSFSHAEDLEILARCLKRQREKNDLPFIGLIGSKTKWASFRRRMLERGFTAQELAHVTCPIGLPRIAGKEPDVIAASVAAQLLQYRTL